VTKGIPFERILHAAEAFDPQVLVQGTHGITGLEHAVIGGTAERVIRKTLCPVLSVKPREFGSFLGKILAGIGILDGEGRDEEGLREAYPFPPRRILYPTDFSEASRLAMDHAAHIASIADAELVVLHATGESAGDFGSGQDEEDGAGTPPADPAEQMEDLLRAMKALFENLRITTRIVVDRATSAILSFTLQEKVDLIVMGTHGRTGLGIMLTGSTADRVIRNAPCPVLTVRPNWKAEEVEKRFRKIFRRLGPADLQQISQKNQGRIDRDLLGSPSGLKESDLFLKYYSREGMHRAFEAYGLFDLLRKKGFDDFRIVFNLQDPFRQVMRVYHGGKEDPEKLLMDLIAREGVLHPPAEEARASGRHFSVLSIEWICLQNPTASFTQDRPPLPGQTFPGLGIGYEVQEFLILVGKRLRKDGITNHPQYYHNARLYHEKFRFLDPVHEGRLIAMIRDTGDHNLADVSWAVHHGCLLDGLTDERVNWEGGNLVHPLTDELEQYLLSEPYRDTVWETVANSRYRIHWEMFRERMESVSD
jgi:nucleotide-binding universal stress UspA family protein